MTSGTANAPLANLLSGISHGDHSCLMFSTIEDQVKITAPYLAIGLERDERSLFVGTPDSVERVRAGLKDKGVNVDHEISRNRLILSSDRDYLDNGKFNTDKMLGFLQQAYDAAMSERFTALRATGDVHWEVGPDEDFRDIVYYEAMLDIFFLGKKMVGMCQYHQHKCPPEVLSGVLNTHRTAAIADHLCQNHHYVPPELLLEKDPKIRQRRRAEWMTSQLLRARNAEEARQQAMEALNIEKQNLEKALKERNSLQDQLHQSQKMEAIGQLAGGVAHDFNNLLTVISGYSEMLLTESPPASRTHQRVSQIREAAARAASLTRQLLAFSRKQILQPVLLNVNTVVAGMDKMLRRLIGEDVDILTSLDPNLPATRADPGQIEQIVMNLAVNARDAMPDGGKLTIETSAVTLDEEYVAVHPEAQVGRYIQIAVSDTGIGMDAVTQARIFEPFFTTKELGKGTGLGLSTVYGIVKQSGGSINVYSEVGHGTTFKVYLPVASGRAVNTSQPDKKAAPSRGVGTILLVEDDASVRLLLTTILQDGGYTVLSTGDPKEAMRLCREHGNELNMLLTDVVLPGINGRLVAEEASRVCPRIKIVFMSGYTDNAVAHRGILAPDVAFIEKPISPNALLEKVQAYLQGAS